jgi:hypothetical protein
VATGRPHLINCTNHFMRRSLPLLLILLACTGADKASAIGSIYCGEANGRFICTAVVGKTSTPDAINEASSECIHSTPHRDYCNPMPNAFFNECWAIYVGAVDQSRGTAASATGKSEVEARTNAEAACERQFGKCTHVITACDFPPKAAPTTLVQAQRDPSDDGISALTHALRALNELDTDLTIAAVVINIILFLGLFKTIKNHRRRLYVLAVLAGSGLVLSAVFSLLMQLPLHGYLTAILLVLQRTCAFAFYTAGIPWAILAVAKFAPVIVNLIDDQGLPDKHDHPSQDVEVLFKQSNRMNIFNRGIFMLDARLGLNQKQFSDVRKYRLARQVVYDSARRQKRSELARTHLLLAAQQETGKTATLQQQIAGFFRTIYYLFRALFSWLLSFFFVRIRLGKLIRGAHVESKNLSRILEVRQAVETAAEDLKIYLSVASTFDGREDLFEPK